MRWNVGGADRAVRVILGIVLIPTAYLALSGTLAVVAYVVGAVALLTGLFRFCPANALFGIDTSRSGEAGSR